MSSIAANTVSLATNSASQTPSERAITTLLRLVLYPPGSHPSTIASSTAGPSFLSGSAPRDRRGKVARRSLLLKSKGSHSTGDSDGFGLGFGNDGSGMGTEAGGDEREMEREFLESLRSPNLDPDEDESPVPIGNRGNGTAEAGSVGGGVGREEENGTIVVNSGIGVESLGTGPGGWGPPTEGGTVSGRRAAIYDSSGSGRLREELEDDEIGMGDLTYPGGSTAPGTASGLSTRRPSRV